MEKEAAKAAIESRLHKIVHSSPKIKNAFLLIHSGKQDIHWSMGFGQTGDAPAHADQPYHTASIGKTFTAVLVAMLAEKGEISFNDPISKFVSETTLKSYIFIKERIIQKLLRLGIY